MGGSNRSRRDFILRSGAATIASLATPDRRRKSRLVDDRFDPPMLAKLLFSRVAEISGGARRAGLRPAKSRRQP